MNINKGLLIKRLRDSLKMSQNDFAQFLGYTQSNNQANVNANLEIELKHAKEKITLLEQMLKMKDEFIEALKKNS